MRRKIEEKFIAQNEVNVQGELANKTDNRTVSYKHRTRRTLVQIKWWYLYDPYPTVEMKHITSLCNY